MKRNHCYFLILLSLGMRLTATSAAADRLVGSIRSRFSDLWKAIATCCIGCETGPSCYSIRLSRNWKRFTNRFFSALLLIGMLLASAGAEAATYRFTNVADTMTSAPIATFNSFGAGLDSMRLYTSYPAAISGNTVAFYGAFGGSHGVFTGSGGPLTVIAKKSDSAPDGTFNQLSEITLSNTSVAFRGRFALPGQSNAFGVFSGDGGPLTTIANTGVSAPSGIFLSVLDPSISGGTVAFRGTDNDGNGVFVSNGGQITTLLREGDAGASGIFTAFLNVVISESSVAFLAKHSGHSGVFRTSEGMVTKIAKHADASPHGLLTGFHELSASGNRVAFRVIYGNGSKSGIVYGAGEALTTVAVTGSAASFGTFIGFNEPAISGTTVAFRGLYTGGDGIFIGNGGPLTTVIKSGDPMFGSTIVSVGLGRFGIDPGDTGNLAFTYALADGRFGVAIASPVPEPSSVVLLGVSMLTAVLAIWRQQRSMQ